MDKLKSRKFWICVAALLASIGTSIAGLRSDNEVIVAIGTWKTFCCPEMLLRKELDTS